MAQDTDGNRIEVMDAKGKKQAEVVIPSKLAETLQSAAAGIAEFAHDGAAKVTKEESEIQKLYEQIVQASDAISYRNVVAMLENRELPGDGGMSPQAALDEIKHPAYGMDTYRHLRRATQFAVCGQLLGAETSRNQSVKDAQRAYEAKLKELEGAHGVYLNKLKETGVLVPYYEIISTRVLGDAFEPAWDVARRPLGIELLWSYWMEEGLLTQTVNAVCMRFQNRRVRPGPGPDPLFRFDLSPLAPVSNLIWSYVEAEPHRTSVRRRFHAYNEAYGVSPHGGVPVMTTVNPRKAFLAAFHNLLYRCADFYEETDNRMIRPDGFPVLNALREVHLILGEGNHNQLGELTVASRVEMLIQQYILARSAVARFLGGPPMTPYPEPWMDRVDTMRGLLGLAGPSILHFHDLAESGERILLAVRNGPWSPGTSAAAKVFATLLREDVQRYMHAYQAVTGVDLTIRPSAEMPSTLIRRRFASANAS